MRIKTSLYLLQGKETAVANLRVDGHTFTGEAKKHPNDFPDDHIGRNYAIGRALRAAAEWYEGEADRLVERNNNSGMYSGTFVEKHRSPGEWSTGPWYYYPSVSMTEVDT